MKKIAHFGAFDHSSFGDLILPRVAEHFLPDFQIINVAPTSIPAGWSDARPIIGVDQALRISDWDGILVGGGDIIQAGAWNSEKWKRHTDIPFSGLPGLWVGACLLSARLNIPLAWNAPGVPTAIPANYRQIVQLALEASDYISVRDQHSANNLLPHTAKEILVVPDSAALLNQVWQPKIDRSRYLVLSVGKGDVYLRSKDLKKGLHVFSETTQRRVKFGLVQLMPWEFEYEDYAKAIDHIELNPDFITPLSLNKTLQSIGRASGYVGNSLHGLIAAISYGIPAVLVSPIGKPSHKYQGFIAAAGLNPSLYNAGSWTEAFELLSAQASPPSLDTNITAALKAHWTKIGAVFNNKNRSSKQAVWSAFTELVLGEGTQLGLHGLSINYLTDLTKRELGNLSSSVSEREDQIANLNQVVSEKEVQLTHFANVVSQSEAQVADLTKTLSEREGHIVQLTLSVSEREDQIANLNQVLSEKEVQLAHFANVVSQSEAQVAGLTRTLSEREGHIGQLQRLVTERDAQMGLLHQAVGQRDSLVITLNQSVKERDIETGALRSAVMAAETQIASLKIAQTAAEKRNSELDSLLSLRDAAISALHQSVAERDTHLEALYTKLQSEQDHVAQLEVAASEAQSQIGELKRAAAEGDAHIGVLSQANAESNSLIAKLTAANAELDQTLLAHQGQIASLQHLLEVRSGEVNHLNQTLLERGVQISGLQAEVAEGRQQILHLNDETVRRGKWALGLDAELKEERARHLAVVASNSWKLTLPLREARRWISAPVQQAKKYARVTLGLAKRGYQALPLSMATKAAHRQWLAQAFPTVLRASGTHASTIPALSIPQVPVIQNPIEESAANVSAEVGSDIYLERAAAINTPTAPEAVVSVIIPVYGKLEYTLRCLESIAKYIPKTPLEIIVVDDCSPDDSFEALSRTQGVRVIRNETNQGFIRSCNVGAAAAKGTYVHFLNNDTEVTAGWLDELVRTFSEMPGTGLVGSKLIYPDGRLQEAGGIIWRDGSAWNFGRFQDPLLPVYNYAREVDYCSGASIMVPAELFRELGGFDEHYLPAYCEDSDLALKIRDKGHRVVYQPLSTVVHYEGITSGTDTKQGAKAYQVDNSKKLFERWQHRLQTHQAPGTDVDNAKDRRATRRVLVLDHCTPTPNQDAGSVTAFNLLLLLREMDFQVTFVPEDNFLYMTEYTTGLQRVGIEVLYAPYVNSVEQHLKENGQRYELVFLFRPAVVERHLRTIRKLCANAKVIFETADLHHLRMYREAELYGDPVKQMAADEMKTRELWAIGAVDATIVRSNAEIEMLHRMVPSAKLWLFPLIMGSKGRRKQFSERRDIVFVGGYQHSPNGDAVKYFVSEIMPLLRQQLPTVRFYAVGSNPPAEIQALATEDVIITGFVEDLTALLDQMRVSVAPLRYGAGIKGKIGTAMAVGLPVVATTLAAEGMSLTNGENICVADGAEGIAAAVIKIYNDQDLWNSISNNGLNFAKKSWGAETAWEILARILRDLSINVKRSEQQLSLYSEFEWHHTLPLNLPWLKPIASVKSRKDFEQVLKCDAINKITEFERELLNSKNAECFSLDGLCIPCEKTVAFLVDMKSGGQRHANGWIPNWRERLECPLCKMNNRQRLVATLVKQELSARQGQHVYFMEHVTPIFDWASQTFMQHQLVGSEYLGHEYEGGAIINGIRHEDVENLSFPDDSLDLIVSNDVFEHVPNPAKAFAECARVLKPGGTMLATIPFHRDSDISVSRARLSNGQIEHFLAPSFHGNPVSLEGSLVFTDFGWDLINIIETAGFSDVVVDIYASVEHGHLGNGQLVFRASKSGY